MVRSTFLVTTLAMAFGGCAHQGARATDAAPTSNTAAPTDDPGSEGDRNACARAADCCEAFIDRLAGAAPGLRPSEICAGVRALAVDSACEPGRPACGGESSAESACTAAIDGWRQALSAHGAPLPAACD